MSVQVGLLNFDGDHVTLPQLTGIVHPVEEFGTDGESSYIAGQIGMLYRAFHCTAESRGERQPLLSKGGHVIVWTGRLDNRKELIAEMSDPEGDQSDVALVAAMFDSYGSNCLARLLGDWALAVWNPHDKELLLARDCIGVRSLFYRVTKRRVIWSNHLLALVESEKPLTISEEFIAGYLLSKPKSTLTPYAEIQSVEPGTCVRIKGRAALSERYWKFRSGRILSYKTDAEYEEHYRQVFATSVRSRLRTDSPILAELSGGYDSSSVVCMSDRIASTEGRQPVDTFTFVDRGEPDEEDSIYSAIVERTRGRSGHRLEVHGSSDAFQLQASEFKCIPGFGGRDEINRVLPRILNTGGYKVVLSGLAGDEFNGQAVDFRLVLVELLRRLRLIKGCRQLISWSLDTRIPAIQIALQTIGVMTGIRNTIPTVDPWVNEEFASRNGNAGMRSQASLWWKPNTKDVCETAARYGGLLTHRPPTREERRYPFLDRRFLEFLSSVPITQLLRPGERRSLMRRSLRGIVPAEILARKTKAGAARTLPLTIGKQWNVLENTILTDMLAARMGIINHKTFVDTLIGMKHGVLPARPVAFIKALAVEVWLRSLAEHGVVTFRFDVGRVA